MNNRRVAHPMSAYRHEALRPSTYFLVNFHLHCSFPFAFSLCKVHESCTPFPAKVWILEVQGN